MFSKIVLALALAASATSCKMDPPYLLVTFHGGEGEGDVDNVYKYTRDGCLLSDAHLDNPADVSFHELRGVTVLPSGLLLAANAWKKDSFVAAYDTCSGESATRAYLGTIDEANIDDGDQLLVHPYGLAFSERDSKLFVSNQAWQNLTVASTAPPSGHPHLSSAHIVRITPQNTNI